MGIGRKPPTLSCLLLCVATVCALLSFSLSPNPNFLKFSTNSLLIYSLLNTIIFAILARSARYRPDHGLDEHRSFAFFVESESKGDEYVENCHDDDDVHYDGASDGYYEDDDDNGSDGEVGWEDDEEYDSELERKFEVFITKVVNGWREEWVIENLHTGSLSQRPRVA